MLWLILALLICVALAAAVLGIVAVPARREGRQLLTERGEALVSQVADRTDKVAQGAKGATSKAATVARRRDAAPSSAPEGDNTKP